VLASISFEPCMLLIANTQLHFSGAPPSYFRDFNVLGYYFDWFWSRLTIKNRSLIPIERVSLSILNIRNERVILDTDLSLLYGSNHKAS